MAGTELQNEVFFFYTKDMNIYNDNSKKGKQKKKQTYSCFFLLYLMICALREYSVKKRWKEKKMQTHPVVNMKSTDAMLQQNTVMFLWDIVQQHGLASTWPQLTYPKQLT